MGVNFFFLKFKNLQKKSLPRSVDSGMPRFFLDTGSPRAAHLSPGNYFYFQAWRNRLTQASSLKEK